MSFLNYLTEQLSNNKLYELVFTKDQKFLPEEIYNDFISEVTSFTDEDFENEFKDNPEAMISVNYGEFGEEEPIIEITDIIKKDIMNRYGDSEMFDKALVIKTKVDKLKHSIEFLIRIISKG